jgi:hypothetical protein
MQKLGHSLTRTKRNKSCRKISQMLDQVWLSSSRSGTPLLVLDFLAHDPFDNSFFKDADSDYLIITFQGLTMQSFGNCFYIFCFL